MSQVNNNVDPEFLSRNPQKPLNLFAVLGVVAGLLGAILAIILTAFHLAREPTAAITEEIPTDNTALYKELLTFQDNLNKYVPQGTDLLNPTAIQQLEDSHTALIGKCKGASEKASQDFSSSTFSAKLRPHFEATIRELLALHNSPALPNTPKQIEDEIEHLLGTTACAGTQYEGKTLAGILSDYNALYKRLAEADLKNAQLDIANAGLVNKSAESERKLTAATLEKEQLNQRLQALEDANNQEKNTQKTQLDALQLQLEEEMKAHKTVSDQLLLSTNERNTLDSELQTIKSQVGNNDPTLGAGLLQAEMEKVKALQEQNLQRDTTIQDLERQVHDLQLNLNLLERQNEEQQRAFVASPVEKDNEIADLRSKLLNSTLELDVVRFQLRAREEELDDLIKRNEMTEDCMKKLRFENSTQLNDQFTQLENQMKTQVANFESELNELKVENEVIKKFNDELETKKEESENNFNNQIQSLVHANKLLTVEILGLETRNKDLLDQIETLTDAVKSAAISKEEEINVINLKNQNQVFELDKQITQLTIQNNQIVEENEKLESEVNSLKKKLDSVQDENENVGDEIEPQLKDQIQTLEIEKKQLHDQISACRTQYNDLLDQIKTGTESIAKLTAENKRINLFLEEAQKQNIKAVEQFKKKFSLLSKKHSEIISSLKNQYNAQIEAKDDQIKNLQSQFEKAVQESKIKSEKLSQQLKTKRIQTKKLDEEVNAKQCDIIKLTEKNIKDCESYLNQNKDLEFKLKNADQKFEKETKIYEQNLRLKDTEIENLKEEVHKLSFNPDTIITTKLNTLYDTHLRDINADNVFEQMKATLTDLKKSPAAMEKFEQSALNQENIFSAYRECIALFGGSDTFCNLYFEEVVFRNPTLKNTMPALQIKLERMRRSSSLFQEKLIMDFFINAIQTHPGKEMPEILTELRRDYYNDTWKNFFELLESFDPSKPVSQSIVESIDPYPELRDCLERFTQSNKGKFKNLDERKFMSLVTTSKLEFSIMSTWVNEREEDLLNLINLMSNTSFNMIVTAENHYSMIRFE